LIVGFCCVEEKPFGPVHDHVGAVPCTVALRSNALPVQRLLEFAEAVAVDRVTAVVTLTEAVVLPQLLVAVTW